MGIMVFFSGSSRVYGLVGAWPYVVVSKDNIVCCFLLYSHAIDRCILDINTPSIDKTCCQQYGQNLDDSIFRSCVLRRLLALLACCGKDPRWCLANDRWITSYINKNCRIATFMYISRTLHDMILVCIASDMGLRPQAW